MADDLDLEARLPSPSSALPYLLLLPPTPRDDDNDEDDIIGSSSSFPSSGNCSQSGRAAGRDGGPRSSRAMQKGSGRRGGRFGEGKRRRAEREEEIGGHCSSSDGISLAYKIIKYYTKIFVCFCSNFLIN